MDEEKSPSTFLMTAREYCLEFESFSEGYEIVPDGQASAVGESFGQFCHQLFAVCCSFPC